MKKVALSIALSQLCSMVFSDSYAQFIEFPDAHTGGKFNISVEVVTFAFKKDSIYNSLSGKDIPNKFHCEFLFGKYAFRARIFDSKNKEVLILGKGFLDKSFGKYADQDGFLKSYDTTTNTEHFQYRKEGYDISFQKIAVYSDNWIKIHLVASINVAASKVVKWYAFYGKGDFLYNTVTHEIKQN